MSGQEHPWAQEDLSNCCPACFDFSDFAQDRSVGITINGNFQHLRFKDRGWINYEQFEPRKFVSCGVRDLSSPETGAADNAGCNNKFHATGRWGKTLNTSSKKHIDVSFDSGIPLAVLALSPYR
jgi:hypothetical protein